MQILLLGDYDNQNEDEEKHAQTDGDVKERFFNSAPGRKNATRVVPSQPAQADALALQDHAGDERN
jgi:hypothetical protein